MTKLDKQKYLDTLAEHLETQWNDAIICRVEVDLPHWLLQLTGDDHWEVYSEDESENCVSFIMRSNSKSKKSNNQSPHAKFAEVTLYHNGHATVDIDGKMMFDGVLTTKENDCAHLSYYHANSGERITLH